jgi:hypothetical protein
MMITSGVRQLLIPRAGRRSGATDVMQISSMIGLGHGRPSEHVAGS